MIKDYLILGSSVIFRPFLFLFMRKLSGSVVHVAFIKLGGLSKYINDLCIHRDYNLVTEVKGFIILYIRGVPFFLGRRNKLYHLPTDCLYHVHQLSKNEYRDALFLIDKNYIVTAHDYYYICERFFMLDPDFQLCELDECCCTNKERRKWIGQILLNAKVVIVPDASMLDILTRYYGASWRVIPHGI